MSGSLGYSRRLIRHLSFALFIACLVGSSEGFKKVNVASLLNGQDPGSWDVFAIYQVPDGDLFLRPWYNDTWKNEKRLKATEARKGSPLAAVYYYNNNNEYGEYTNFHLLYLNDDDYIIQATARIFYGTLGLESWRTYNTRAKSDSGLAIDPKGDVYYIDTESHQIMKIANGTMSEDETTSKLGVKAAPGSTLSMAYDADTENLYLFYIAEDHSLSYIVGEGEKWGKAQLAVKEFTSDPGIGFAAMALSDPLEIRVFYIDKNRSPREWVFNNGSWDHSPEPLTDERANSAGQPVASAIFGNRSLEYFYASKRTMKDLIKHPGRKWGVGELKSFDIYSAPKPPLERADKIALGTSLGIGIPGLIIALAGVMQWRKRARRGLTGRKDTNAM